MWLRHLLALALTCIPLLMMTHLGIRTLRLADSMVGPGCPAVAVFPTLGVALVILSIMRRGSRRLSGALLCSTMQ